MSNSIIIYLLIAFGIIFICSLIFIFSKKEQKDPTNNSLAASEEKENNSEIISQPELEIIPDNKNDVDKTDSLNVDHNEIYEEISKTETLDEPKVTIIEKDEPKLSISISSKTEKILLNKLQEFEDSKAFIKKDVNLNNLAKKFETNTKYLSEIIKTYKNKNFNNYLNDLRINHLISELKTNEKVLNTKVSYLASDFGFSSHSSFSTIFTQYVGQTPSEYIKNLKQEKSKSSAL